MALFLGNHEECHVWLRANTGFAEGAAEVEVAPAMAGEPKDLEDQQAPEPLHTAERAYTDRELRTVFAGLCGG